MHSTIRTDRQREFVKTLWMIGRDASHVKDSPRVFEKPVHAALIGTIRIAFQENVEKLLGPTRHKRYNCFRAARQRALFG
ncbi:MAG TPA: hypothetical protein VG297_18295 [Bryobacteraceae bacterium]|nr:hypothetical protein [Bryobacteraceae bacterium]